MSYIRPLEMCAFIFNALSTESLTLTIYIERTVLPFPAATYLFLSN